MNMTSTNLSNTKFILGFGSRPSIVTRINLHSRYTIVLFRLVLVQKIIRAAQGLSDFSITGIPALNKSEFGNLPTTNSPDVTSMELDAQVEYDVQTQNCFSTHHQRHYKTPSAAESSIVASVPLLNGKHLIILSFH